MERVHYELDGRVARVRLDDGKVNAINGEWLAQLEQALEQAQAEAGAVAIIGRPELFCAGLDLRSIPGLPQDERREVLLQFCSTMLRLFAHPQPVVAAVTGHAIAGGCVTLLGADHRVGARGNFKIGLNEVAIGLPLPTFVVEMARLALAPTALGPAVNGAVLFGPGPALKSGYLHELVDQQDVAERAVEVATALAELPAEAYAVTKGRLRGPALDRGQSSYRSEIDRFLGAFPGG